MRALGSVGLLVVSTLLLGGCDKNCQNTCRHIYSDGECNIQTPGRQSEEAIRDCVSECRGALQESGEMGDYNPYNRRNPLFQVELENDVQAAEWMDCVWSKECSDLDPAMGFCAPI